MTTVKMIYDYIDEFAPFDTQMGFDNAGFLVGDASQTIKKALIALDITMPVIAEASKLGAQLIIAHHPVIFKAVKNVKKGSVVYELIKNDISAICAHTNADMAYGGVNDILAEKLGLSDIVEFGKEYSDKYKKIVVFVPENYADDVMKAMGESGAGRLGNYSNCSFYCDGKGSFLPCEGSNPFIGSSGVTECVDEVKIEMICHPRKVDDVVSAMLKAHPYEVPAYDIFEDSVLREEYFIGRLGELNEEMECKDFALHVKKSIDSSAVVYTPTDKRIKKVAVCGGAASEYWHEAAKLDADALVTGEVKHHEFIDARQSGFMLVAAGHHETENPITEVFRKILSERFPDTEFMVSTEGRRPTEAV